MLVSGRVDSLEENQQIFPTSVVNPCGSWVEQADSLDWSEGSFFFWLRTLKKTGAR